MSTFYDILLDADGDLPITTQHVRGWLVVVQRVQFRLSTFKGEWILDTAAGLPYLEWRSTKNPNRREIGARIQQEITSTPGVKRIVSFSSAFDEQAQRLSFDIQLEVQDAPETVGLTFFPFGQTKANTNPIALYTAPSKTIL